MILIIFNLKLIQRIKRNIIKIRIASNRLISRISTETSAIFQF